MLRLTTAVLSIAFVACYAQTLNPLPLEAAHVKAGRSLESLQIVSPGDQAEFLGYMTWCDWRTDWNTTPGPDSVYEVVPESGDPLYVLATGSRFYVGQAFCQLPSTQADAVWRMAERSES